MTRRKPIAVLAVVLGLLVFAASDALARGGGGGGGGGGW